MDALLASCGTFDTSYPLPIPPEPAPEPSNNDDYSDDSGDPDTKTFPYDVVVAWIDNKMDRPENVELVNRVKNLNSKLFILCFPTLDAFSNWVVQDGYQYGHILKIITCGYRPDDGKAKSVENVVNYRDEDPSISKAPVMVYCGDPTPHQAMIKRGVIVTTLSTAFVEFCSKY